MDYSLILDLLFAGLLAATLVYVGRLTRRLDGLRAGREEFEGLVTRFAAATEHAQQNVTAMKAAADGAGRALQEEINRARGLREDLAFLADRANGLSDQLEAAIGRARVPAKVARMPARGEPRIVASAETPRSAAARAERPAAAGRVAGTTLSTSETELLRRLSTLR